MVWIAVARIGPDRQHLLSGPSIQPKSGSPAYAASKAVLLAWLFPSTG